jgi:hypothetical protein
MYQVPEKLFKRWLLGSWKEVSDDWDTKIGLQTKIMPDSLYSALLTFGEQDSKLKDQKNARESWSLTGYLNMPSVGFSDCTIYDFLCLDF